VQVEHSNEIKVNVHVRRQATRWLILDYLEDQSVRKIRAGQKALQRYFGILTL
jgi:hypothetical protein